MIKIKKKLSLFILFTLFFTLLAFFNPNAQAVANDGRSLYFVTERESVAMIAEKKGIEAELLAAMNNLSPQNVLAPGKSIWLPEEPEDIITVEKGDTLWDLAIEYHTTVQTLVTVNGVKSSDILRIGQKLKVPVIDDYDDKAPAITVAKTNTKVETASRGGTFSWPLKGVITSKYGKRGSGFHHGLDIAAVKGTSIAAVKAGKVIQAGWYSNIYGYAVTIDHGNNEQSMYAHDSAVLVKKGDSVKKGQIIAKVGATGNATGPHLHLQITINGKTVDPLIYLR